MTEADNSKPNKRPAWTRGLDLVLRTAHVAVAGILFGGAVFELPLPLLSAWQYLTIATGCALIASEIYHRPHWLYQGRGIMVIIHVVLFGLMRPLPHLAIPLLTVTLVTGMTGSHMPRTLRYWSFIHRRIID